MLLETTKYDFGSVAFGGSYSKDFLITNNTGSTVFILKVDKGGCSCVTASVAQKEIPNGKSALLKTTIKPGSKGIFKRSPYITYKTDKFGPVTESVILTANVH